MYLSTACHTIWLYRLKDGHGPLNHAEYELLYCRSGIHRRYRESLLFIAFCIWLWAKGPKFQGRSNKLVVFLFVASCFIWVPLTTQAAQDKHIIASHFSNIAQGYENYGFVYGFSSSVVDRGMSKPDAYSKKKIESIEDSVEVSGYQPL